MRHPPGTGLQVALLRHFPTDWNAARRLQGRTDRPLSEDARRRLATLALPAPWNARPVHSSPLSRAKETASLLGGREPETDPAFSELCWGTWEGRTGEALTAEEESYRPTGDLDWHDAPHGGESPAAAWDRIRPGLRRLAGRGAPVILVTHKGVMRIILSLARFGTFQPGEAASVRSARLYPVWLSPDGMPCAAEEPVRLVPRATGHG